MTTPGNVTVVTAHYRQKRRTREKERKSETISRLYYKVGKATIGLDLSLRMSPKYASFIV
jgi:hypothetical protein